MNTKYCNKCKSMLPVNMFNLRNKNGTMLAAYCKPCKNEITRAWAKRKAEERLSEIAPRFKGIDLLGEYIARWYA